MNDTRFNAGRRRLVTGIATMGATGLLAGCSIFGGRPKAPIAALFAGRIDDDGFMESGYNGLIKVRDELGVPIRYIDKVEPKPDLLAAALRQLVKDGAALVIAHGGQNNEAAQRVAKEFPGTTFVVTQGAVTGPNLASYEIMQEASAWLAGAAAGMMTRTGVVGHMSGIRVRPGLKGRAAYAAGLRTVNPNARLLTNFSGTQDDNDVSYRIARAEIDAGADIIFTMLNAGRDGVTRACRERGAKQIGNVVDWVAINPEVFIASAVANVSIGVFNAARDFTQGKLKPGTINKISLEDEQAVRLTLGKEAPPNVVARIAQYRQDILTGKIIIPENYDGPEFNPA